MLSQEIRNRFIKFFEKRGHAHIPSASLVPDEKDNSVLFNTAGMQPLVPYLIGNPHPKGRRLANVQKCVRMQDIEEVGDKTHDTFFEMIGNWSLGDYFKEEAIEWSYKLLTDKEEGFGLDPKRLYITVFEGNEDAPKDNEAFEIWKKYMPENRIYFMGVKSNWWSMGADGPSGPDTEMFYDVTPEGLGDMTKEQYMKADDEQKVVEIWNDVFMEYLKKDGRVVGKLSQKNVDTGAGLERLVMALQGKDNIFDTDLFAPMMAALPTGGNIKSSRIISDHIRTSVFIISDGVTPSNTGRGYILRRLLRRSYVHGRKLGVEVDTLNQVADIVVNHPSYQGLYNFDQETGKIIYEEIEKFKKALDAGLKQVEKGADPFILFTSYGLPLEIIEEVTTVDREKFNKQMEEHKQMSSVAGEQKFKNKL
jgi:alanyl-tRNA synthetase